jgi:hypothetical protein
MKITTNTATTEITATIGIIIFFFGPLLLAEFIGMLPEAGEAGASGAPEVFGPSGAGGIAGPPLTGFGPAGLGAGSAGILPAGTSGAFGPSGAGGIAGRPFAGLGLGLGFADDGSIKIFFLVMFIYITKV